jgi:hypothetical protein
MPRARLIPNSKRIRALIIGAVGWTATGTLALGGEPALRVSEAWVPATEKTGTDVPLLMTVSNDNESASRLRLVTDSPAPSPSRRRAPSKRR